MKKLLLLAARQAAWTILFLLQGWFILAALQSLGWLHVEYLGPVWIEGPTTSAVLYLLGGLQVALAGIVASEFLDMRARVNAANIEADNEAKIAAAYLERLEAAEDALEQQRDLVDPVREAMRHGMTDADLITVCDAYEGYSSRWVEHFGHDPGGMDFPLEPFSLWWHELLNPKGAEMDEYGEYLNRREEAMQLGHIPNHACLTFNQWKDDTYWRERLAYHPTSSLRLPDQTFLKRPSHPDFYHRPRGFEVINADL
jgi:hypothetical protein